MTSAVTRDEVEYELWKGGIRSPSVVSKIMRVIDIYAISAARKYTAAAPPEPPFEPYWYLKPGQGDPSEGVIRCDGACGRPKRADMFHVDKDGPLGRKTTCKSCLRKARESSTQEAKGWKCPDCGKRKVADEYPEDKRQNPRLRIACLSCGQE